MEATSAFCSKKWVLPSFTRVKVDFTSFAQPDLNRGLNHLWIKLANPVYCHWFNCTLII